MRYATVLAGLVAAVSVVAQEDQGATGSMTTLAIIETTQSIIVESTISSSADSLVATSTEVLVVDTTTTEAPAVSGTQAASPAEVSRAACLDECKPYNSVNCYRKRQLQKRQQTNTCCCTGDADDNDCRAECGKIANAVNPIADCQTGCFQGNGTDKDNKAYEGCMQDCVRTATTLDAAVSTSTSSAGETTETAEVTATTTSGKFYHPRKRPN